VANVLYSSECQATMSSTPFPFPLSQSAPSTSYRNSGSSYSVPPTSGVTVASNSRTPALVTGATSASVTPLPIATSAFPNSDSLFIQAQTQAAVKKRQIEYNFLDFFYDGFATLTNCVNTLPLSFHNGAITSGMLYLGLGRYEGRTLLQRSDTPWYNWTYDGSAVSIGNGIFCDSGPWGIDWYSNALTECEHRVALTVLRKSPTIDLL
jgi:hypothetical protein